MKQATFKNDVDDGGVNNDYYANDGYADDFDIVDAKDGDAYAIGSDDVNDDETDVSNASKHHISL